MGVEKIIQSAMMFAIIETIAVACTNARAAWIREMIISISSRNGRNEIAE